jgi:predicted lysophospholipase L1 biosynthesis ABC-type transport system permease subunit
VARATRAEESEHPRHRHRRDPAPGARHHGPRLARGGVRVPVHARWRLAGVAGAIAATQDERKFDAAILRTLGASQKQLRSAQVAEFLLLGALAGTVAAAGATATGWALADRVFKIPFEANPMVWVYGILGGAIAVTLAGWLGTRSTTRQPPLAVIRQLT